MEAMIAVAVLEAFPGEIKEKTRGQDGLQGEDTSYQPGLKQIQHSKIPFNLSYQPAALVAQFLV